MCIWWGNIWLILNLAVEVLATECFIQIYSISNTKASWINICLQFYLKNVAYCWKSHSLNICIFGWISIVQFKIIFVTLDSAILGLHASHNSQFPNCHAAFYPHSPVKIVRNVRTTGNTCQPCVLYRTVYCVTYRALATPVVPGFITQHLHTNERFVVHVANSENHSALRSMLLTLMMMMLKRPVR